MEKEKIFKRYKNRDDLTGEHAFGDAGQVILLFIFLGVWVMDSFFFKYSIIITDQIPFYIRILLAIIVLIVAGYLAKSGLTIVFGEVRKEPTVIRNGVFGIVRHPIYLGAILSYFGLLLFSLSILATIVWIIIILFYFFLCRHEEKLLIAKFGKAYKMYMSEIPMLIPLKNRRIKNEYTK